MQKEIPKKKSTLEDYSIGTRLSIKLNASYISNVIDTPNEKDNLIVKKKAFSGKPL